jgi:hypothetical protein
MIPLMLMRKNKELEKQNTALQSRLTEAEGLLRDAGAIMRGFGRVFPNICAQTMWKIEQFQREAGRFE